MNYLAKLLDIDEFSITPKYLQIANGVISAINNKKLQKNDALPSINVLSAEFQVSRDTVERGYKYLKEIGVIGSVNGKGYFVKHADFSQPYKVLLLFNKLSTHKKIVYDAFAEELGESASIDFYIYNNDFNLFKKIIEDKINDDYTHYVILPHFLEGKEFAYQVLNMIEKDKLILLDQRVTGVKGHFGMVYEDFGADIYEALTTATTRLRNYSTLKMLFPQNSYYPEEIVTGFKQYCKDNTFKHTLITDDNYVISKGDVFITVMEHDLVELVEKIRAGNFAIGKEVGVISYNETPLKRIILNGITTISTNFKQMGQLAARLILTHTQEHVQLPFELTLRSSL